MPAFYHVLLGFRIYPWLYSRIALRVGASLLTLRKRGRSYDGLKSTDHAAI